MEETLDLARWQFALTAAGHFLFVALTLGLATVVACVQTRACVSGDPVHLRMVRFWGQLYVINYAVGIVTGIVMEFQFGLAWSGLGHYAGNVFGASLAMETIVAFFIESTFLGLWIFGWNRFNKWVHLALLWVVTLTAYLSAGALLAGVLSGDPAAPAPGADTALTAAAVATLVAAHGLAVAALRLTGRPHERARLTAAEHGGGGPTFALTGLVMAVLPLAAGARLPLAESAAEGPALGLLVPALLAVTPLLLVAQLWLWRTFRHRVTEPSYL